VQIGSENKGVGYREAADLNAAMAAEGIVQYSQWLIGRLIVKW